MVRFAVFGGASVLASRPHHALARPRRLVSSLAPPKSATTENSNAVDKAVILNHNASVPSETFKASRLTRGNFLFPTIIEVTDRSVVRRKRSWFSKDEISISISKVASVHIKTGILWSDVLIESSGGSDPLISHGHRKADARRIRELVETAQGSLDGPEKLKLS